MKNFKKVLALVLVIATVLSFATVASAKTADYKDAKDVKNTEAVDILSAIGVLNGYTDGEYKPNRVISRAEAAKIIAMFDNGDTDIKELYAPVNFTDVAAKHWAQSYISYCYHTGIIAGIGNNKYAPEAEVTGVQFLKMVLVVLGFDAKEEGLVGTGYSVRTRNLAREVGLLAGIGNDFDYTKGLTRDNAAQIMLNALQSNTVEYGKTYDYGFISDTKAVYTNETLASEWNLCVTYTKDVFGRPSHIWYFHDNDYPNHIKDVKIGEYVDTPVVTYTTAVYGCDVYDDLGVELTKTYEDPDKDPTAGVIAYTDGVKNVSRETLTDDKKCSTGAQGQLTEIYAIYGGKGNQAVVNYEIVHINTYLAKVTDVNPEKKDAKGHVTYNRDVELTTYVRAGNENYNARTCSTFEYTDNFTTEDFAKYDYVLVNGVVAKRDDKTGITPVVVTAAKSEQTKLTGISSDNMTYYVNGTATPVACKYAYEADRKYVDQKNWASLTFFYDAYGNVIGTSAYAAPKNFAVVDSMNVNYETYGKANVYATLYTITGEKLENVKINNIYADSQLDWCGMTDDGKSAGKWIANLDDGSWSKDKEGNWSSSAAYRFQFQWNGSAFYVANFYARIMDYIVNEDGTYDLYLGDYTNVYKGTFKTTKGSPIVKGENVALRATDKTYFVLQTKAAPNGEYIFKTGYADVPSIVASSIQYKLASDGTLEYVYMAVAHDASTDVAGYWTGAVYYNNGAYHYTVKKLVEGKLEDVDVTSKTAIDGLTAKKFGTFTTDYNGNVTFAAANTWTVAAVTDGNNNQMPSYYKLSASGETDFNLDLYGDNAAKFFNLAGDGVTAAGLNGKTVYVEFAADGSVAGVYYFG